MHRHPMRHLVHHARWLTAGLLAGAHWAAMAAGEPITFTRADGVTVSARAYAPSGTACVGVAVASHGAGGQAGGLAALGEHLAALGFYTVVPGHGESGAAAVRARIRADGLRQGLGAVVTDPAAYRARLMDVEAARAAAQARCPGRRSLLVGHSMGAATVMLEAGATSPLGVQGRDAFDAYVALSPQGPGPLFADGAWAGVRKPVLLVTGTRDTELGGQPWSHRTTAFQQLPAGCAWLAVLDGATHRDVSAQGDADAARKVLGTVRAFVDAVGRADCTPPPREAGLTLQAR